MALPCVDFSGLNAQSKGSSVLFLFVFGAIDKFLGILYGFLIIIIVGMVTNMQKNLIFLKFILVFLFITLFLGFLSYKGYEQSWTGFQAYINHKGELIPPKKLWDWLQLLIIPSLLAVGVWWLNRSQKKSEQQIETDKQRQQALEDYYDCMTDLLLKENLRDSAKGEEARSIARTRTLAILRILDGNRKAQALQFLYESGLINKDPIIALNGADLSKADLTNATLIGAELRGVYLNNAQLIGASLSEADLRGSDFSNADLTGADLSGSDLTHSILKAAKLRKADLSGAILLWADLTKADLNDVRGYNP